MQGIGLNFSKITKETEHYFWSMIQRITFHILPASGMNTTSLILSEIPYEKYNNKSLEKPAEGEVYRLQMQSISRRVE